MGQGSSSGGGHSMRENIESLHNQLMRHAGADYDIATTTTLTYDHFLAYITQLNQICREYKDGDGHVLVFAVKKGTDSTIFWKATVRIACVKLNTANNKVESYRLLNIRQFLQVFRRITYECTGGSLGGVDGWAAEEATEGTPERQGPVPPTMAASIILGGMRAVPGNGLRGTNLDAPSSPSNSSRTEASQSTTRPEATSNLNLESGSCGTNLEECVICLERRPDVILPCAHAYCMPCIEQWWEYARPPDHHCSAARYVFATAVVDKTCPVCRESLKSTDDTWVLSEAPDDDLVNAEIRRTLIGLAGDET